jgi:hypothetical protein
MAANTVPIFPLTPHVGMGQLTVANANRDGTTGTYVTLFSAGANGSMIGLIPLHAAVTTTAGMVRLFLTDGSTTRLIDEIPVSAVTPGANTEAWSDVSTVLYGQVIPSGWSIKASTEKAEAINAFVLAGDY